MTQHEFAELKSLIQLNAQGISSNHEKFAELKALIQVNAQGISRNHETAQQQFAELKSLIQENAQGIGENKRGISRNNEMIGRIYEEHGGRLTRVEVGQEQLSDDLRAVAEGVTGNAERLDRLEGRRWT